METPIPINPDLIFIGIPFGLSKPNVKRASTTSSRMVFKGRVREVLNKTIPSVVRQTASKQLKTLRSHGCPAHLSQNLNAA